MPRGIYDRSKAKKRKPVKQTKRAYHRMAKPLNLSDEMKKYNTADTEASVAVHDVAVDMFKNEVTHYRTELEKAQKLIKDYEAVFVHYNNQLKAIGLIATSFVSFSQRS